MAERQLAVEMRDAHDVAAAAADEHDDVGRHDDALRLRSRRPLPHEALGPAVRRRPLMSGIDALVIELAHHALLILGRQDREERRHLRRAAVVPDAPAFGQILAVDAVPLRHRLVACASSVRRVCARRLAAPRSARRPSRTRTGSRCSRAASPSRSLPSAPRRGGFAPMRGSDVPAPGAAAAHVGDLTRAVAAPIARVQPLVAVLIEILAREEIARERLDSRRRLRVPRGALAEAREIRRRIDRRERRAAQARARAAASTARMRPNCRMPARRATALR